MINMSQFPFLRETPEGILIDIYVQPKAAKNEIAGIHEESLKIRLTAPPVEGAANKECVKFLAKLFHVPKSDLDIVRGHKSRHKTILIRGSSLEKIEHVLNEGRLLA